MSGILFFIFASCEPLKATRGHFQIWLSIRLYLLRAVWMGFTLVEWSVTWGLFFTSFKVIQVPNVPHRLLIFTLGALLFYQWTSLFPKISWTISSSLTSELSCPFSTLWVLLAATCLFIYLFFLFLLFLNFSKCIVCSLYVILYIKIMFVVYILLYCPLV